MHLALPQVLCQPPTLTRAHALKGLVVFKCSKYYVYHVSVEYQAFYYMYWPEFYTPNVYRTVCGSSHVLSAWEHINDGQ